ncbi:MAG TPA: hypothetical protein VGB77_11545 [Abditibacteriaceae bacterium]|jgi:hypothetical protein
MTFGFLLSYNARSRIIEAMNSESSLVQGELDSGERLLWTARPNPGRVSQQNIGGFFVGIFVTGFAIFWMSSAFWMQSQSSQHFGPSSGPPLEGIFPFFGLIFVGFGLYMMASPFVGAAKASNTIYAITDKRILVIENSTTRTVKSYGPNDIQNVERREQSDGSGDIIFAREQYFTHHNGHRHARTREIGLWGIPNAREAERLIRENLKQD